MRRIILLFLFIASGALAQTERGFGTYTYDASGNVISIGDAAAADTFVYDRFGRLESARLRGEPCIDMPVPPCRTEKYAYDRFGNIVTITTAGNTPPARSLVVDAQTNRLAGAGITYDARGNLLTAQSRQFTYDGLNMTTSSQIGDLKRLYVYSATDERVVTVGIENGSFTGSDWSIRDAGGRVLRRLARAPDQTFTWTEDYVYRNGQLLSAEVRGPEKVRNFHVDHLGTPRLITGNGGAQIAAHHYRPFGVETASSTWDDEKAKFTGHERDAPSLDYMHARYYDPNLGRFLSVDPHLGDARVPQSWNRYTYSLNNPIRFLDPTGRDCTTIPITGEEEETEQVVCTEEITVYGDPVPPTNAEIAFGVFADAVDTTMMQLLEPTVGKLSEGLLEDDPAKIASGIGSTVAMAAPGGAAASRSAATRVFWSGGTSAEAAAYAETIGGKTLEMTLTGKTLEAAGKVVGEKAMQPLWRLASREFAAGARGEVVAIHGRVVETGRVWATVEYPALMKNSSVQGIRYFVVLAGKLVGVP